jgi:hypothetical protein
MSTRLRAFLVSFVICFVSSAAVAVEVNLWLDRVTVNGKPVAVQPATPHGPGSVIDIDAAGVMIRAVLNLEGYTLEDPGTLAEDYAPGDISVAPWAGTLERIGSSYGVRDPRYPQAALTTWHYDWGLGGIRRGSDVWNVHFMRMASQSDFSGELSLTLADEHATPIGSEWVYWELTFAFESISTSAPPPCSDDVVLLDDDGDGEANARDARAGQLDDSFGPGVDENGLSIAEFCSLGSQTTCTALDFRNDEPQRRRPADCRLARTAGGDACQPAEFFGTSARATASRACAGRALFDDADGDGEPDPTDRCPGTPLGSVIDGNGCSAEQFCSQQTLQLCRRADFRNDEPLAKQPGDCARARAKPRACAAATPN